MEILLVICVIGTIVSWIRANRAESEVRMQALDIARLKSDLQDSEQRKKFITDYYSGLLREKDQRLLAANREINNLRYSVRYE